MYPDWVLGSVLLGLIIWSGVLSYLFLKQKSFLTELFPKSGERDIRKKFEETVSVIRKFEQDLGILDDRLEGFKKDSLKNVQKVELLRYNPYDDTGGDQSFSVAVLDKKGDGVVITSLHARSGTRVFAKPVAEGKALKFQFSKEEEVVIKKTLKN